MKYPWVTHYSIPIYNGKCIIVANKHDFRDEMTYLKFQRLLGYSLEIDKYFNPTMYNGCN